MLMQLTITLRPERYSTIKIVRCDAILFDKIYQNFVLHNFSYFQYFFADVLVPLQAATSTVSYNITTETTSSPASLLSKALLNCITFSLISVAESQDWLYSKCSTHSRDTRTFYAGGGQRGKVLLLPM